MTRNVTGQSGYGPLWLRPLLLRCPSMCFCKADLAMERTHHGPWLCQLGECHNSVSHPCIYLNMNGIFCPPQEIRFLKTRVFMSCLSAMSLITTWGFLRSVRVKEVFRGQICGCLSGFRCQVFTSWLEVGWALHCMNDPAPHCHSPSHHTGPHNYGHLKRAAFWLVVE